MKNSGCDVQEFESVRRVLGVCADWGCGDGAMVYNRGKAKASDHPPEAPAEATDMLFPPETFAELINVPVGGLKVPMGHDGLIFKGVRSRQMDQDKDERKGGR